MNVRSIRWLAALCASLVVTGSVVAEDARPQADEKCLEQCDIKSDECMEDSGGDKDKVQACDDRYSECLQACE